MNRIPFSVYDFFGYLASGFLLLGTVDYLVGQGWVLRDDLRVTYTLVLIGAAYVAGQILASPSAWLLERMMVGKWLMPPSINLFGNPPKTWWAKLFPGYFTPLPAPIRKTVQEKAKVGGITEPGEALFIHAFGNVKADGGAMARLNTFLGLYGSCRNISFTCLLAALAIAVGSWSGGTSDKLPWAVLAMAGSVGMFYRYLKFLRQYSYEVFITYAALPPKEAGCGD